MNLIEPFHPGDIRIGDFVGLMIFANYLRIIKNHSHLIFNLHHVKKQIHESLNIKLLFNRVIDEFVDYDPLFREPNIELCGSGCIWISVPFLFHKYGHQILPHLTFDDSQYTGPNLTELKNYICFSPLFDGAYHSPRHMSLMFCNDLIDFLYLKYRDNFIVITDRPDKIKNKHVRCVVDSNLYNLIYIIAHSKVFIGGDTGFTHFAGLCRPRGLISLYEFNQFRLFEDLRNYEQYPGGYWNSDPVIDRSKTIHLHLNMVNNSIPNLKSIYDFIDMIINEKII